MTLTPNPAPAPYTAAQAFQVAHPTYTLPGNEADPACGFALRVGTLWCPDSLGGEPLVVEAVAYAPGLDCTVIVCRPLEQVDADAIVTHFTGSLL
jgi:hypothetical protein